MVVEEIRSIKSNKAELRKFGITMGIMFSLLGGLFLWRGRDYYSHLFILSIVFLFFGVVAPVLLRPIHKAWMTLAILMGWVMTRVILSLLFYLIVTPLGFVARLFRKDSLDIKYDKITNSYWILRKQSEFDRKKYENQF